MTRQLYCPGKRTGTHCTGGWVCPRAGLDRCKKSHSTRAAEDEVSYINYPKCAYSLQFRDGGF